MTLIAADHISKFYGPTVALREVCCDINRGERVCLMGANGAGKSTLLRCWVGLERPDRGRALLDGENVSQPSGFARIKRTLRLGYFSGASFFYGNLTILENLELTGKLYNIRNVRGTVEQLSSKLDLNMSLSKLPAACSQGVSRRASFARAVLAAPDALFCDEPFAHLDADGAQRVLAVLRELTAGGSTIVCATHEPWFAQEFATRILTLHQGRLMSDSESAPPGSDHRRAESA